MIYNINKLNIHFLNLCLPIAKNGVIKKRVVLG